MNRSRTASSSVASGAAALLQKARGHTRGQNFASESRSNTNTFTPQKKAAKKDEDNEDDIAAYLSQLSKKTSGKSKSFPADDISSGLSDLSLSDDQGSKVKQHSNNTSQQFNKFLKKSTTSPLVKSSSGPLTSSPKKSTASRPASAIAKKPSSSFTSSALQKASKLSAKINARKQGVAGPIDSDSSDQGDEGATKGINASGSLGGVNLPFSDAPEIADGNRFLKKTPSKAPAPKPAPDSPSASSISEDSDYPVGGLHAQNSIDGTAGWMGNEKTWKSLGGTDGGNLTSTPAKGGKKKGSVYNRIMAQLDTDEEDMDDLIGGVSELSSPEPVVTHTKREAKRAVTPYKPPAPVSEISSDDGSHSMSSTPRQTGHQPMTVEDLEPAAVDYLSSIQSDRDSSIAEDISLGPTLAGLQTLDDLLPRAPYSPSPSPEGRGKDTPVNDDYQDDFESVTDRTVSPEIIRSPSPRPILVEETDSSIASASSVPEVSDHSESKTVADSYSSVTSRSSRTRRSRSYSKSSLESYSRRRSRSGSRTSRSRSKSYSSYSRSRSRSRSRARSDTSHSVSTIRSKSNSYTDDFTTASHSSDETITDDKTLTDDYSSSHSKRHRPSSRRSTRSRGSRHKAKKVGKDAAIQTSASLHSIDTHWLKDTNFQTPGYFKLVSANIHETMSHSVDPMVLQTLSSFDPSSLDLHASLAEQVRQTRLAVTNTLRQHQSFLESLQENYTYTTLEDTKKFIKRQKKRRRRREEETEAALKEVDMNVEL